MWSASAPDRAASPRRSSRSTASWSSSLWGGFVPAFGREVGIGIRWLWFQHRLHCGPHPLRRRRRRRSRGRGRLGRRSSLTVCGSKGSSAKPRVWLLHRGLLDANLGYLNILPHDAIRPARGRSSGAQVDARCRQGVARPWQHGLLGGRQFASMLDNQPVAQSNDCVECTVEDEVRQERNTADARRCAGQPSVSQ